MIRDTSTFLSFPWSLFRLGCRRSSPCHSPKFSSLRSTRVNRPTPGCEPDIGSDCCENDKRAELHGYSFVVTILGVTFIFGSYFLASTSTASREKNSPAAYGSSHMTHRSVHLQCWSTWGRRIALFRSQVSRTARLSVSHSLCETP